VKRRVKQGQSHEARAAEGRSLGLDEDVLDERDLDFHPDELREFLEADLVDVPADPDFKERLRRKLWDLVRQRTSTRDPH
jgi:hypothetical protein